MCSPQNQTKIFDFNIFMNQKKSRLQKWLLQQRSALQV